MTLCFSNDGENKNNYFIKTIKTKLIKTGATAIKLMTNIKKERNRRTEHITAKKTAFNVKNKRGRKPKVNNINEVETTEIIEKPRRGRGRPKKQNIITK